MMDDDLERLLAYHRRRYWLTNGWSIWLRVWKVEATPQRPHGLRYSFSLHDVDKERLLGFDNADRIRETVEHDHRHVFRSIGTRRPYHFVDGDKLLVDFFAAVNTACRSEGVSFNIDYEDMIGADEECHGEESE